MKMMNEVRLDARRHELRVNSVQFLTNKNNYKQNLY